MNYNLICIFICTPTCTKFLFLQKVGVTEFEVDPIDKVVRNIPI
jgi:hypothetical protein